MRKVTKQRIALATVLTIVSITQASLPIQIFLFVLALALLISLITEEE
jgi:hypothetical protein